MNERLQYLLNQFSANGLTQEEFDELMLFVNAPDNEAQIKAWLMRDLEAVDPSDYNKEYWPQFFRERMGHPSTTLRAGSGHEASTKNTKIIPMRRRWIKWIAAASVILIASFLVILSLTKNDNSTPPTAQTQEQRFKNDIAPGGFKARLTLADGSIIVLDSAAEGQLTTQGQTAVINKDGQLVYTLRQAQGDNQIVYNTLATAKGETYSVTLSDGTKVWLNSASSLRYPASFASAAVRQVEITGEAFFEVTHNAAKPFKVLVNGMEVEDLGTEFNINAYSDEPEIRTTLISGSARVSANSASSAVKLNPGEQAVSNPANPLIQKILVSDIDAITAWKDNRFYFKSTDIKTLMRQLARWYDVDIVYEDLPQTGFNARISRTTPISSILKALELTGEVKFRIEGKKITVFK